MYNNGVSHKTDQSDLHGVYTILKWLSYIPKVSFLLGFNYVCFVKTAVIFKDKLSPLPIINPADPVDREIGFMPTKAPYDPRFMLAGRQSPSKFD